jgi:hypothetical protein
VCEAIETRARVLLSGLEEDAPAADPAKAAKSRKRKVLGPAARFSSGGEP